MGGSGSCFRAFSTTGGAGEEALVFDAKKSDNPDLDLAGGGGGLSVGLDCLTTEVALSPGEGTFTACLGCLSCDFDLCFCLLDVNKLLNPFFSFLSESTLD